MKNKNYQIVQFSFTNVSNVNGGVSSKINCYIELFNLVNQQPFDDKQLIEQLSEKSKESAEVQAINEVILQFEKDDIQIETLALLKDMDFEHAMLEKHKFIKQIKKPNKLLNHIVSLDDEKELLNKKYTQQVVQYFKNHQDDYPALTVKSLSKLRNLAVRLMLNGYQIESALDEAYEQVADS